mgnify:CR=1 FL=1
MKALMRRIVNSITSPTRESDEIYRDLDRQRARALGPSDLAEIDAIFSRAA